MKKNKKQFPLSLIVVALIAGLMLSFTTVQGARAALNEKSDNYDSTLTMKTIGVGVVDKEENVIDTVLNVDNMSLGTPMETYAAVKNTGEIEEYVRVVVYKYWTTNGEKDITLDPSYITLLSNSSKWIEDTSAQTKERSIFYYSEPLGSEEVTESFLDGILVSSDIKKCATAVKDGNKITVTYDYDGKGIQLEIEADGVQAHNYLDAAKSAWGVDIDSKIGG